jgi:hypothetical protein
MLKLFNLEITNTTSEYCSFGLIYLIPTIEYRHKYWYLWEISLLFLKYHFNIQILRSDWNGEEQG